MKTEQISSEHIATIGQNAEDNHQIIREADPKALWFHVSEYPSAHVIINPHPKKAQYIYKSALLAKQNSKVSKEHNIRIVYTPVSNLILTKKAGEVKFKKIKLLKFITI